MPFYPGPEWYIAFHELDPSTDFQCIYYTQKEERCRWPSDDNGRAVELHGLITTLPHGSLNLDLLIEYVLCCCCMSGRAKHRLRIEDRQELLPLAERWLDEAQRRIIATTPSVPSSEDNDDDNHDTSSTQVSSANHTTTNSTPPNSPPSLGSNKLDLVVDETPPEPVANSSSILDATNSTNQSFESQTRYSLRSGNTSTTKDSGSALAAIYRAPQSEFAPHVTSCSPNDMVSQKLFEPLVYDDFRTGSLYIFDRLSSPGHVKIGYTSRSVAGRLEQWSGCGYTPNLLFEVDDVPYVRRAETLTHHELINEWRRERRCNHGRGCASAHQGWFEISIERSSKVLGDWADFMKRAEPYDAEGCLKPQWTEIVELWDAEQEMVTAQKLLEHYEASLVENETLVEELAPLELMPEVKETNVSNEASNTQKISVKEDMSREQIPLPPSPLLQSTASATNQPSAEEIGEISSTTIENGNESDPNENHPFARPEAEIEASVLMSAPTEIIAQTQSTIETQLSEALLNLQVHDREETRETASSPSRWQQKPTEEAQTDAETESYNEDNTIVADEEHEIWNGDDITLLAADQTLSLELESLKIVDELPNGIPTGRSSVISKTLDTVTVPENEVQPDVAVVE